MRVGLDATPLLLPKSGVGRYVSELLAALPAWAPENEYRPLSHRPLPPGEPVPLGLLPAGIARLPLPLRTFWLQIYLPRVLRRQDLDVCHFTNYLAPLSAPSPSVVTFHDMSLFLLPDTYLRRQVLAIRPFLPLVARQADAIITPSESARRDLLTRLPEAAGRVHVVYEAAGARFRPVTDRARLDQVARQYCLPDRFLLFVGTVEPRKNLLRVVEALAQLRRAGDCASLVIAGQMGWKSRDLLALIENLDLGSAVHFLGYVPDDDLPAIFSQAAALIFPSLDEGFGLPVLEAMACGAPVVTSNTGAVAEIAGSAAVLVDPRRSAAIAEGLATVLGDDTLRQILIAAGSARSAEFTWECAARQTAAIYASVVDCVQPKLREESTEMGNGH